MYRDNDIEKVFNEDIRDKKKTASGARYMTGKRGLIGSVKFNYDYMDRKAKKEYMKGSEIKVSNFYEDINNVPPLKELEEKFKVDPKGVRATMTALKELHSSKKLCEHWGCSNGKLYGRYDRFGVEYAKGTSPNKGGRKKKEKDNEVLITNTPQELIEKQQNIMREVLLQQQIQTQQNIIQAPQEEAEELFQIKYIKKEALGETIQNGIVNLVGILDKDKRYSVKLVVTELGE